MKTHITIITLFACLTLISCNNNGLNDAAQKYLDATGEYNIEEACKYATPETAAGLRNIGNTLMKMVDSSYIRANTPATINITSTHIVNDTIAKVAFHKKTPIQEFDDTLTMVNRNGTWMATLNIAVPKMIENASKGISKDGITKETFHFDTSSCLTANKIQHEQKAE